MFAAGIQMAQDGSLWTHIGTTLWETVAGFVLGTILGTLTAVLLWWNRFVSDVAEPYLVVLNSLPKTALAPIIIVWIGNNQTSIIVVALLTSVVVTIMSVLNGFLQVDHEKIKLIQIFGGTKLQVLAKVVFPANFERTENQCRAFLRWRYRRGVPCRTVRSGFPDCLRRADFQAGLGYAQCDCSGCACGSNV